MNKNKIISEDIENIISKTLDWKYLEGKTILITGANGFIPSYIVYSLLGLNNKIFINNPMSIIALVRNKEKAQKKFSQYFPRDDFMVIENDVSENINVNRKIDIIIHAASQASPKYYGVDPVGTLKANTLGTANLLDFARKNNVEKFVFFSSGEVYGVLDGSINIIPETYTGNVDITNVRACYGESKRMGENMCVCWAHQYGFHVNMLRLAHTYGPGVELDDGRVFGDFVKNVINNEDIKLNSDGKAKRTFLYITDMIIAFFYILLYGENKQAYNIAANEETEIKELATMLCNMYPEKNISVKLNEILIKEGYIRAESKGAKLSTDKLEKLGWKQEVSIERGFRRMIESYY